jgi:hypothetical protein
VLQFQVKQTTKHVLKAVGIEKEAMTADNIKGPPDIFISR